MISEHLADPQSPYDIDGEFSHMNLRESSADQSHHSVFFENFFLVHNVLTSP